jgi:uncharacterized protein YneR
MNNFLKIGDIDTRGIKKFCSVVDHLFKLETFRQDHPLSPHKDTETYYIMWPRSLDAESAINSTEFYIRDSGLAYWLTYTLLGINYFEDKRICRAALVKLKPGGFISPHIDQGKFAEITDRFHIGIDTNVLSMLSVEHEAKNIKEGEIWYFDKHKMHSAENKGNTARIHLILDFLK